MKRFLLTAALVVLATLTTITANSQNIIVGDKMPEIKLRKWLMDFAPTQRTSTCYLFYHTESELCQHSLEKVKALVEPLAEQMNLVIVTKQSYDEAGVTLTEHLGDNIFVAFDQQGRMFRSLKVSFIPFCIIIDKRRYVLWCGNPATISQDVIDNILTTK